MQIRFEQAMNQPPCEVALSGMNEDAAGEIVGHHDGRSGAAVVDGRHVVRLQAKCKRRRREQFTVGTVRAGWASSIAWWLAPECLILVDVADDEAKRVGEQHLVGHLVAEAVDDIRSPAFPPLFLLVPRGNERLSQTPHARDMEAGACLQAPRP